ncbi:phosphomannomutase [Tubulinosema ratisbonensis]|uniref:Phosphomannomutase n=1 Tax=Tubulinosema ratisbonensis TaxID=291195 RepID=A0A437AMI4_9MICR|nr:phosphomannomutase [Tubulinosema ratisbonensis]
MDNRKKVLFLFDVDGTLTPSRLKISDDMKKALTKLKEKVYIGFVGGSDIAKQKEQVGDDILDLFDFGFPENGVSFYRGKELVSQESILEFIGDEKYNNFVNFCLRYLADLDIPKKRGTFIELRKSMINISQIGRNCSQEERMEYFKLDKEKEFRKKMVKALQTEFHDLGLQFSIGGQISIDCFPKGWDKTYCLRHVQDFEKIIFFGDMIHEGGNDYEIFIHKRTKGVGVNGPEETILKIEEELKKID